MAVLAAVAVLGAGTWYLVRPGGGASTTGQAGQHHAAGAAARPDSPPAGLPAAESGLLPWHLPEPLSRAVVVPGAAGRLVVLGGLTASGATLSGVYAIQTRTGVARPLGSLRAPLHDAAAAVAGGRALVFGGGSSTSVPGVQSAPVTGPWPGAAARAAGTLPQARSDAAAVTIGATSYLVGGYDGTRPDAAVLATTDGRAFQPVASLPVPVRYPAVAALGGQIYVFGGQAVTGPQAGTPVDAIQLVSPARHTATVIGHLPERLTGAAALTVRGEVFLAGGDSPAAQPHAPGVGATQLPPGERGGSTGAEASIATHTVRTIWAFNPATRRLLPGQLQVPVSHAAATVTGGTGWIVGGESGGSLVSVAQMLRPDRAFGTAGAPGAGLAVLRRPAAHRGPGQQPDPVLR